MYPDIDAEWLTVVPAAGPCSRELRAKSSSSHFVPARIAKLANANGPLEKETRFELTKTTAVVIQFKF